MAPSGIQLLVWIAASICNGAPGAYALSIDGPGADPLLTAYRKSYGWHASMARPKNFAHDPECGEFRGEDMHLPLAQVQARYPNKDLWCHFGFVGPWVHQCAVARKMKDYGHYYKTISNGLKVIKNNNKPWRMRFGKFDVETKDHWHPLDDALCVAHGFYDIPRDEIFDWVAMNDRSYHFCNHLLHLKMTEQWANMSLADFMAEELSDSELLYEERKRLRREKGDNGTWTEEEKTNWIGGEDSYLEQFGDGLLKHEVAKCLLGTSACDMAYCAGRGCLRADGKIIYSPSKECPNLPVGRLADVRNKKTRKRPLR